MKNQLIQFLNGLIVIGMITYATSCKKEETDPHALASLFELNVLSPDSNQIFRPNDTIFLKGLGRGPIEAHGYTVFLVSKHNSDTLFKRYKHTHGLEIMIIEHIITDDSYQNGQYSAGFILHVDHSGSQLYKNIPLEITENTL